MFTEFFLKLAYRLIFDDLAFLLRDISFVHEFLPVQDGEPAWW